MSHQPERKEKDCLNCGTIVNGRYCHVCGQENMVAKQSFWGLTRHFIYDIFHFDGKFFETLKYLLTRPGKVPKEYVSGKRMKYLDPIRMYLFTSAVFFLIFFSVRDISDILNTAVGRQMTRTERFAEASRVHSLLEKDPADSFLHYRLGLLLDTTKTLELVKDSATSENDSFLVDLPEGRFILHPQTVSPVFDSAEKANWFEGKLTERWKEKKEKYGDDDRKMLSDLSNEFMHKLPYLLFVSLPVFALLLKLLYIRRKNFFYSDHAIFTLYHYIFSFILLLLFFGFDALEKWLHWNVFIWIITALTFSWPLYLLLGMKKFYGQGWGRTLGKFLLVNLLGFVTLIVLFLIFLLLSFVF